MTKFLVLYRSTSAAAEQMAAADPASGAESMREWMEWAASAGDAVIDLGSPTQTVANPDPGATSFIGGYSLLQADSAETLQTVLQGHPHLAWGGTIEVLELLPIPGM